MKWIIIIIIITAFFEAGVLLSSYERILDKTATKLDIRID